MIVKGGSRSGAAFFARHLMRADHNERVAVMEIRGLVARTVAEALREMEAIAHGTHATRHFYHASLNPDPGETLTPAQWVQATDILEHALGFTDQPRFVVEHEKGGRIHRHAIWSRIDADTMTALPDGLNYRAHERAARAIEQAFGHQAVPSVLVPAPARGTSRPSRRPNDMESFRAQESRIDPEAMKAEITALWHAADSGASFAAALAAHGHLLARGDRRDFVLVDRAGDDHSLARRIAGVKAAALRARMADIDRNALPSVAEARALARRKPGSGGAAPPALPTPPQPPRDAAEAGARVRAVAAQMMAANRPRRPAARLAPLPRFGPATDAAEAERQIRAVTRPLIEALLTTGELPEIVTTVIDGGIRWFEHAAQQLHDLAEEVTETARDWRDYVLGKGEVDNPHTPIDRD